VITIYGIKSCDTCRKARKFLSERNIEYNFHDLREDGLDSQMLERWMRRMDWERLMNKKSLTWRKIPEVDRNDMTREKALAAMIDNPTLVTRPVLETENFIAVGFSEKRFSDFIDSNEL